MRVVLDAVSSLTTAILCSLRVGIVRRCSFNVVVRRDVFNFLFSNCGSRVSRKRGKLYTRTDFNDRFFNNSDFVFYNSCNEGVCVVFPIYMYSCVKLTRLADHVDFVETVCINLVKKRCRIIIKINY